MRKYILALLALSFWQVSYAEISAQNQIDDLGVEAEAEEMELYDQKALNDQTNAETKRLNQEARDVENNIKSMRRENVALGQKIDRQHHKFQDAQRNKIQLEREASKLKKINQTLRAKNESLQTKLERSKREVETARELKISLNQEINQLKKDEKRLTRERKQALDNIKKHKENIRRLQKEQRRLSQNTRKLEGEVKKLNRQADSLAFNY